MNGPVYHGGTQNLVSGDSHHIKTWIDILSRTPYKSATDKEYVKAKIKAITDGYVAVADAPHMLFVEELMELYPDAKVVCTVRDPDAWAASLASTASASLQTLLPFFVFWLPAVSYFPRYARHLQGGRWGELYADPDEKWSTGKGVWNKHMQWLERVVPKEKLVFFDVKEGWGPLCEALEVDEKSVEGMEFPRINDGKAIEEFAASCVRRGLMRWAVFVGVVGVVGALGWKIWRA